MTKIKDITRLLEDIAPLALQESYDNAGLITGDPNKEVTGVLVTLDCTEEIIAEAKEKNCNLIVAHHPIVFRGLKKLSGGSYVERTIVQSIKDDVAIYACHTNLDNVHNGVNDMISERLKLKDRRILASKSETLKLLTVYVPKTHIEEVRQKINDAGAGQIGDYKDCSFSVSGEGRYRPAENANPHVGEIGKLEVANEEKIEFLVPAHLEGKILSTMHNAHPYEEVAYFSIPVTNKNQQIGSGMIGKLEDAMSPTEFLSHLKSCMNLEIIKHTELCKDSIKTVAVCGGSGSFLLNRAKSVKADVFITADFKYHEFFDADGKIIIADIGHYESEVFTKELFLKFISEKFPNIAVVLSNLNTNPTSYFL